MRFVLQNPDIVSNCRSSGLGLYYLGGMYRRENPQKGRLREFVQLGVEALGVRSPIIDAQAILMANHFLQVLGVDTQIFNLEINTLGGKEEREIYKLHLTSYLKSKEEKLSPASHKRLEEGKNIFRVLDSKSSSDIDVCKGAPLIMDYLPNHCLDYYRSVLESEYIYIYIY